MVQKKSSQILAHFFVVLMVSLFSFSTTVAQQITDTQLKVAYTYNFTKYVTWGNESVLEDFHVVQLGDDEELFDELNRLTQLKVKKGKSVRVTQTSSLENFTIEDVRILYVARDQNSNLGKILDRVKGTNTLIVSDNASEYRYTMINFVTDEKGRIQIEVNTNNLDSQQLTVAPKIVVLGGTNLEVAEVYEKSLAEKIEKIINQEEVIKNQQQEIKEQQLELNVQKLEISAQAQKVTLQNLTIKEKENKIQFQDKKLSKQHDILDKGEARLNELPSKLKKREKLYEEQLSQIHHQQTEISIAEKQIKGYNKTIEDKVKKIEQQKENISSQARQINFQRTILTFSLLLLSLVLILVVLVYYYYKVKKEANIQLQEKNDLLKVQKTKIVEQGETIKRNARLQEQFLVNTSHELRTPMNAINGFVDLINKTPEANKKQEYLNYIQLSAKNVINISNDILDIAKIESGEIKFEKIAFDVKTVVENAVNTLKFKAEEKELELKISWLKKNIPIAIGDPTRLNQILVNLISNAVKFTGKGSVDVMIDYYLSPQLEANTVELNIKVKDTGIGIPVDNFGTIFEKFAQSGSDITRRYGGTGLGLSITKQLIELQGGSIQVESELDKGSVFSCTIPYEIGEQEEIIEQVEEID